MIMSPRTGRPPLPDDQRRTDRLVIRLTPDELEALTRAAGNLSVSSWLRDLGLAAAAGQ